MRQYDEIQKFKIGEDVQLTEQIGSHESGQVGKVNSIISQSNYYEHRPIACFLTFTYVVSFDDEKLYLNANQIRSFLKKQLETVTI